MRAECSSLLHFRLPCPVDSSKCHRSGHNAICCVKLGQPVDPSTMRRYSGLSFRPRARALIAAFPNHCQAVRPSRITQQSGSAHRHLLPWHGAVTTSTLALAAAFGLAVASSEETLTTTCCSVLSRVTRIRARVRTRARTRIQFQYKR